MDVEKEKRSSYKLTANNGEEIHEVKDITKEGKRSTKGYILTCR